VPVPVPVPVSVSVSVFRPGSPIFAGYPFFGASLAPIRAICAFAGDRLAFSRSASVFFGFLASRLDLFWLFATTISDLFCCI
jgi:hypothetical protein